MNLDLLSTTSRVEAPFVIAKIAGYSFGAYSTSSIDRSGSYSGMVANYPNFIKSLKVRKINGTVNTYTLVLNYSIRPNDDPNLIEKILSSASNNREIIFTYGDCSVPSFIFKEEHALITDVKSSFNISATSIQYTITAVSQATLASAGSFSFPSKTAKPSDVIKELLYNSQYGLLDVFTGMQDKNKVLTYGLIASDDAVVQLEAKSGISPIAYLKYLVSCMSANQENSDTIKSDLYTLVVCDEVSNIWDGVYFKVVKLGTINTNINSLDTYEIDIGYLNSNAVMSFTIDDDETYSLLYDYAGSIQQAEYIYRLNDDGNMEAIYSPTIINSSIKLTATEANKNWWSNVTQYPISGTITIKGLLKPAILMTYVKLNVWFYGKKHLSSGYYIVTQQDDQIDESGYRSTLKLVRIKGDDSYIGV